MANNLAIRTDIEAGASIKKILDQEDLKKYYVENSDLLGAFHSIYDKEYKSPRYNNFKNILQKIDIPQNLHFLLEFSEEQIMAPLIITQKDEEAVQNLFDFFMTNKVNEKHVQAAMKRLREMRKLGKKTAV